MKRHEFTATLFVYDDGTLVVRDSSIRGLVLETTSLAKMRSELERVVPQLLVFNHKLKEGDTARVVIRLERCTETTSDEAMSKQRSRQSLELMWADHPNIESLVLA